MSLLLLLCLIHLWALYDCLQYIKVSRTGALLSFRTPNLLGQIWEASPAEFGYKKDNGKIEAFVLFLSEDIYHEDCTVESVGLHPYIQHIKQHISADAIEWILIIDRYNCTFVNKVSVAQKLNASAAIICDSEFENIFTMTATANLANNITIPSVLLSRSNCKRLMNAIGIKNWDSTHPASILYPAANNTSYVFAVIEWGLVYWDVIVLIPVVLAFFGFWYPFFVLYVLYKKDQFIERAEKCVATVHEYYYHSDDTYSSVTVEFITNKSSEYNTFRIFQRTNGIGDMKLEKGQIVNIMYDPYNPLQNMVYHLKYPPKRKTCYYYCTFYLFLVTISANVVVSYGFIPELLLSFEYILQPFYIYSYFIGYLIVVNLIIFFGLFFGCRYLIISDQRLRQIEPMRVATKQEIMMFEQRKLEV